MISACSQLDKATDVHHTTPLHPTHHIVVVFTATVLARVLECPRLGRVGFISNKAQLQVNKFLLPCVWRMECGLGTGERAVRLEAGQGTAEHEQGGDEEGSWLDDDWVVPQTAEEANEMWGTRGLTGWRRGQERVGIPGEGEDRCEDEGGNKSMR